jgi:ammonia channel protein AmtB
MVWGGGLLAAHGALDFAGGTVVHINAAVAGLVGAYLIGKRADDGKLSPDATGDVAFLALHQEALS